MSHSKSGAARKRAKREREALALQALARGVVRGVLDTTRPTIKGNPILIRDLVTKDNPFPQGARPIRLRGGGWNPKGKGICVSVPADVYRLYGDGGPNARVVSAGDIKARDAATILGSAHKLFKGKVS